MGRLIDLSGRAFGKLTVLSRVGHKYGQISWVVRCSCAQRTEFVTTGASLRYGIVKSCGCLIKDVVAERLKVSEKEFAVGDVIGKWVVQGISPRKTKAGALMWVVVCSCGSDRRSAVSGSELRLGNSTSCGCSRGRRRVKYPYGWLANKVLITYKEEARKRGLPWSITDNYFYHLINSNCVYCGRCPSNRVKSEIYLRSRKDGLPDFLYSGIDRVDNHAGYEKSNTVPCCRICNAMKQKLSLTSFISHILSVYQHCHAPS